MIMRKIFMTFATNLALLLSSVAFAQSDDVAATNWFGGPVYDGEPALQVTAALVEAGGGADSFSFNEALVSMLGQDAVDAEAIKLTEQYGEESVNDFINGMTFAVRPDSSAPPRPASSCHPRRRI